MKRYLHLLALALVLLVVAPAAQATPAVVRENVRHVTTVPGSTGGHSVVEGDRLYVGAYGLGMRAFDVSDPADPVEIGRYFPGPQPGQPDNDIGVRADAVPDAAVFDGRHLVTLGGTSRSAGAQQTEFLDWTDPADPQLLWRFTDATDGEAHNGDIVDARRLWLPSGGGVGLRIYDLDPLLQETPAAPEKLSSNDPVTLWSESPHRGDQPVGTPFTHIHDIEVYTDYPVLQPEDGWTDQDGDGTPDPTYAPRDIALLAEGGSYLGAGNTGSVFIIDITDPENPVALLRWMHETGADHHPWRYFHEAQFLDSDPSVMIVTDEDLHNGCDAGGVMSIRVAPDLQSATELAEWFNGTGTPAPNCSAHVISTHGPYVFMGSYNAGLQVIDFSDPADPQRAGQYIAAGANSWGALYHAGYVYIGDFGGRGLDVFEFVPEPVAEGYTVPNQAATRASGVNETMCENGQAGGPAVDALEVAVPETMRDGTARIRATGDGPQPYDLNVYFHDENCVFLEGGSLNAEDRDTEGQVPAGAAYAFVTNVLGAPTYTFVQLFPGA